MQDVPEETQGNGGTDTQGTTNDRPQRTKPNVVELQAGGVSKYTA